MQTSDMFAGDGTLHTADKPVWSISNRLQDGLNTVAEWCNANKMEPHPIKTKSLLVTSRQKHQLHPKSLTLSLESTAI